MYTFGVSCIIRTLFILVLVTIQVQAQPDVSQVSVSATLLKNYVFALASDSLQGRETGTVGQQKAALYCIRSFRQSHLLAPFRIDSIRGSFRQTFAFTITNVAIFGSSRTYGIPQTTTYKRHELVPFPTTAKDSNNVLFGDNVAGLIIGTDLKREVVVISAHYDHLGRTDGRIFHGADDNASGTATILSIASLVDSLANQGIKPRRSILFVLFSGEEGGLLGSDHFVHNSPIPLRQMVYNINVDMVGRVDNAHKKKPNYCYILTGPQGDKPLKAVEIINKQSVNLALNQGGYDTENDPKQYFYRSDHYNFFKWNIPTLFFTNGEHPDYHQPSDTADKIDYDILQKRATLVFQTAWFLANESH